MNDTIPGMTIAQPPANVISIGDLIELRIRLDACTQRSPALGEALKNIDTVILSFTQSLTPNQGPTQ